MTKSWLSGGTRVFAAAAFVVSFAAAVLLFLFAVPQADDFYVAAMLRKSGMSALWWGLYTHSGGRWSYHILLETGLMCLDLTRSYVWLLLLPNACVVGGFYAFWRMLLGDATSRLHSWGLALALWVMTWASVPSPGETTYWYTGILIYQVSFAAAFLLMAGLTRLSFDRSRRIRRVLKVAGLCLLAIIATGMQEILSAILCFVLCVGTVFAFLIGSYRRAVWLIVTMAAIGGFLILVLAPGNATRSTEFPLRGEIEHTFLLAEREVAEHLAQWFSDPKLLAATLFLTMNERFLRLRPSWVLWPGIPWKWLVPVLWIAFTLCWFILLPWLTGYRLPVRVVAAAHITFLTGWVVTLFIWTRGIGAQTPTANDAARLVESLALVVLGCAMLCSGNTPKAMHDLLYRAPAWHRAWFARYEQLWEARQEGLGEVVLTPLPEQPALYSPQDAREDMHFYINTHMANYWGLKSVSVTPAALPTVRWHSLYDTQSKLAEVKKALAQGRIFVGEMGLLAVTEEGVKLHVQGTNQIHFLAVEIAPEKETFIRVYIDGAHKCLCYWARKSDLPGHAWAFSEDRRQSASEIQNGVLLFNMTQAPNWNGEVVRLMFGLMSLSKDNRVVLRKIEVGGNEVP
jgi:hypothetical protein